MIHRGNKLTMLATRYRLKRRTEVGGWISSEPAAIFYWVGGI